MPPLRSRTVTHGRNMAGAGALLRATGVAREDFGKPIVAVANGFTEFVPGHVHAAGGVIALAEAGDRVIIDIPGRELTLDVPEQELASRREKMSAVLGGWRPAARNRTVSATLQAYAAMTTSAALGASRDVSQLGAGSVPAR